MLIQVSQGGSGVFLLLLSTMKMAKEHDQKQSCEIGDPFILLPFVHTTVLLRRPYSPDTDTPPDTPANVALEEGCLVHVLIRQLIQAVDIVEPLSGFEIEFFKGCELTEGVFIFFYLYCCCRV